MSRRNSEQPSLPASDVHFLNQVVYRMVPNRNNRRRGILEIFSQHRKKDCLFFAKPFENTKNINLFNSSDFFRCVKHLQTKHSDIFFTDTSAKFELNLKEPKEHYGIIRHFNDLYFVDVEIPTKLNKFCVTVTRLNSNNYSSRHDRYAIEFQHGDTTLVKFGSISLRRNTENAVTTKTSLEGLKSVFRDTDTIRIAVTIELFVTCNKCHDVIALSNTEGKFIIKAGWYCVNCAKSIRTCGYVWQDCLFEGIEEKQKKHGLFFCLFRNICYICRESVRSENGGPIGHYRDKHQDITYLTETIFRLNSTIFGQYCLLEHQTDLMVCYYHLNEDGFYFALRSPWQHEQIKEHRCYITLSRVVISKTMETETKTYEMQKSVERFNDWQIDIKKWTFINWCCAFYVSIKLERIPV